MGEEKQLPSGVGLAVWQKSDRTGNLDTLNSCTDPAVREKLVVEELKANTSLRDSNLLFLSELLWEVREMEYYSSGYSSFKEFLEHELDFPAARGVQLAASYDVWVVGSEVPRPVLEKLSWSKAQITRSLLKKRPDMWEEIVSAMEEKTCEELRAWVREKSGKNDPEEKYIINLNLSEDQNATWVAARELVREDLNDGFVSSQHALEQICREYLANATAERGMRNMGLKLIRLIRMVEEAYHVKLQVVSADESVWSELIEDEESKDIVQAEARQVVGDGRSSGPADQFGQGGGEADPVGAVGDSCGEGVSGYGDEPGELCHWENAGGPEYPASSGEIQLGNGNEVEVSEGDLSEG